jgi:hypothetical protein
MNPMTFAKSAVITFATVAAVAYLLNQTVAGKKFVKTVFAPA